jgi:hypothetical protein
VTYDPVRGNLLLFDGSESTTWTWGAKGWTLHVPPVSPPAGQGGLLAFDAAHRVAVLFGGMPNNTWTWDGKTWTDQHPATSPPPRASGAAMAYEPRSKTVILIGGFDLRGRALNDMWSWNGISWTELHPNRLPPLVEIGMADDGLHLVLFGNPPSLVDGRSASRAWGWDGSTWTELHPTINLPVDYAYPVTTDPGQGSLVFFGGGMGLIHGDTWVWDGSTWARRHPLISPPGRALGHLVYDARLSRALLYGGEGDNGRTLGDLWAWDGSNWSQIGTGPAVADSATSSGPHAVAVTPAGSAAVIRTALATSHPILLPGWLPADLVEAEVTATEQGFNVYYLSDNRDKRVFLGLVVPNPPPGGPHEWSTQVRFRGALATYDVGDATVSLSQRSLEWTQPGTGPATTWLKIGGLPYFLSADGLTDAEFWQVANSLKG